MIFKSTQSVFTYYKFKSKNIIHPIELHKMRIKLNRENLNHYEQDYKQMAGYPLHTVKMSILPKVLCRLIAITLANQMAFFTGLGKNSQVIKNQNLSN